MKPRGINTKLHVVLESFVLSAALVGIDVESWAFMLVLQTTQCN